MKLIEHQKQNKTKKMEVAVSKYVSHFLISDKRSHSHSVSSSLLLPLSCYRSCLKDVKGVKLSNQRRRFRSFGAINVSMSMSVSDTPSPQTQTQTQTQRWLLQPVGDGDTKHIGFQVEMPDAFVIESSETIVGRVAGKADMVIPVATVSGMHARIKNKGDNLVVMDLGSTNGTFVNEKRLKPGLAAVVLPGSYITFGDANLAIFQVSKVSSEELQEKAEEEIPVLQQQVDA